MNSWRAFLAGLSGPELCIVGPFFDPARQFFSEPVIFVDAGTKFRKGKRRALALAMGIHLLGNSILPILGKKIFLILLLPLILCPNLFVK